MWRVLGIVYTHVIQKNCSCYEKGSYLGYAEDADQDSTCVVCYITISGSRPARSDDRRALGRRHPAGAASPHGSLLGEFTGTVISQRLPHLLLPPGRGVCVGSQGRLLASHICDAIRPAFRARRRKASRFERAEPLSFPILLVCFVASSLVCRCFVPP